MATAMTMHATGLHRVGPPGAKRKWSGQGVGPNKQRYTNDGRKIVAPYSGFNKRRVDDVQQQRRTFYAKKRTVPRAPYNDSSFLMKVRRSGGLESSDVALTPSSYMSFPKDSSYKLDTFEDFEDYGYGSMTGLIRLRGGDQSSGCSGVEHSGYDENVCVERPSVHDSMEQMERRLDRGVSRFEMTHPAPRALAQLQVARQDSHIQYLEDENLVLRDRLFSIQQEVEELRRRFQQEQNCVHVDESDESDD